MKTLKHTITNVKFYLDKIQQFTEGYEVPGVTQEKTPNPTVLSTVIKTTKHQAQMVRGLF